MDARSERTIKEYLASVAPDPDAHLEPPFSTVRDSVALLDQLNPEGQPIGRLRTELEALNRQLRAIEAHVARWLAAIDRADQAAGPTAGLLPTSAWLQDSLGLTSSAAYAQIRTARQLQSLPAAATALRQGQIGSQQAAVVCRAVEEAHKTSLDPGTVEADLVLAARELNPLDLRRHWYQMRYQADQEAGLIAERSQRERRWLRFWQTSDDTYRIEGELDPESGAVLKTAFKALRRRHPKDDERTPMQYRADDLTDMARRLLDSGELPTRGGERPHLTLVSTLDTLRLEPGSQLARLDWGPLVTGETARRIAEECVITPVLVNEKQDILYVGRKSRVPTRRQRAALNLRDGHCQTPGCDVPADDCEPHHLRHVADGGRTKLPNLRLHCRPHHHHGQHPENGRFRKRKRRSRQGQPGP